MKDDEMERAREIERLIMDHVRLEVRPGRARIDADSITDAARAILAAQQPEGWVTQVSNAGWKCDACGFSSYIRVSVQLADGQNAPSAWVKCGSCEREYYMVDSRVSDSRSSKVIAANIRSNMVTLLGRHSVSASAIKWDEVEDCVAGAASAIRTFLNIPAPPAAMLDVAPILGEE